ncbi:hypothetical protein [Solwaraspora sp. WMMA2065]|uniref:hypothetical protein n=1 Tax=Solwaraspora sp. WMMA2065 TaxID=3015166 RepID=UPI00259B72A6|nr:hypothetical protein [Solwaraspora sp. WMMA2065]WJK36072.1 hypothetical protein O7610_06895 [Solwaraspora sp. WMMA2065]
MRFAPAAAFIDCSDLPSAAERERPDLADRLSGRAVDLLHDIGFAVFRIGRLRLGVDESRRIALDLAQRIRRTLIFRGAPADMRLEVDKPQSTYVPAGFFTRTLLPHHDGQHCSYLTPSRLDMPEWDPAMREFGTTGYTTTPAHKMYQGIFLADPGEGLSVTTYYDWISIVHEVLGARGIKDADDTVTAARWLGENLRTAVLRQPEHGCPYPSYGAMLGLGETMWHGLSFHHSESPLSSADAERFPAAVPLSRRCACGRCEGDAARLFCHMMLSATGSTWSELRERWEVAAPGEHCDLLIGHNLTMIHGGLRGGPGRVLEPLCMVVDKPEGTEYERWLSAAWRRSLPMPS